jgi:uncharacterized membrane protein YkvA (DUF1232 family)
MNTSVQNPHPLPDVLYRAPDRFGRRHRIDGHEIEEAELDRFNELLVRLDCRRPPLARDQLASAARHVAEEAGNRAADCIRERMRRAGAIDLMLRDAAWDVAEAAAAPAGLVVRYVRDRDDLIPDALPKVGRLDDAIVVDAAWTVLAGEVLQYLDFCRVRQVERGLGNANGLDRAEWERARLAELRLLEHHRRVGGSSYLHEAGREGFHVC